MTDIAGSSNRWDLEDEVEELQETNLALLNRTRFLENSILFILMNQNLHEMLQAILLQKLSSTPGTSGDILYDSVLLDEVEREQLTGPDIIDNYVLETNTASLKRKMAAYKASGNLNL